MTRKCVLYAKPDDGLI